MAKTINELNTELSVITERTDNLSAQLNNLQSNLVRLEQSISTTREQLSSQTARLEEFRKQFEESDRRRFTLVGLIIGAILTLAVNGIVTWLRKS